MGGLLDRLGLGVVLEFYGEDAVKGMNKVNAAAGEMRAGLSKIGSGATQAITALGPAFIAVEGAVAAAVQRFATFEESIAKIGTLLPGGMSEAWKFAGDLEKMSIRFGKAATDVGEGGFQAISAGVKAAEMTSFMDVAMKSAASGFTNTATAVDGLTNLLNAYHLPVRETMRLSDQMFMANQIGKTTFEELAHSIGNVAPTAYLAGVQSDELLSSIAAMTLVGIDTATAVVSVNQALLAFVKPSREAEKAAKKYGIELNSAALKSKGFLKAIADIDAKIGGNEELLATIFGNVRSFRAAATLATGEGRKVFEDTIKSVRGSAGITERNFADVSKTIKFKFAQALQVADAAARRVGKAFVEVFGLGDLDPTKGEAFLDRIESGARRLFESVKRGWEAMDLPGKLHSLAGFADRLSQAFDKVTAGGGDKVLGNIAAFVALGAVLGPVALAIMPIVGALGGLWTMMSGVASLAGGWGALWAGLGAAAWPVALAIGAVVAAAEAVRTNAQGAGTAFGEFAGVLSQVWDSAKNLWDALATGLAPVFSMITNIAGAILVPVFDVLGSVLSQIGDLFDDVAGFVRQLARVLWPIADFVRDVLGPVISFMGKILLEMFVAPFRLGIWFASQVFRVLTSVAGVIGDVIEAVMEFLGITRADDIVKGAGGASGPMPEAGLKTNADGSVSFVTETAPAEAASQSIADSQAAQARATGEAAAAAASKVQLNNTTTVNVDGREVARAVGKQNLELSERAGANVTPWQRRMIIERGAVPAAGRA